MPTYRYELRSPAGQLSTGIMTAANALAAAAALRSRGQTVVQLIPLAQGTTASALAWLKAINYAAGPTQKEVLSFTQQLAVMIRAGIGLRAAIEGIADQTANPRFRTVLLKIKQDIESGRQLSEALARHPRQFGPLYVNMVRASEASGSFSRMLDRISSYLQQQIETRGMILGAMIYPGVIATLAVAVTIFLLTFVLPRFADVFRGKESAMPLPTVLLMGLSHFMVGYWWLVVILMLGTIIGLVLFIRTEIGGWWFDRVKLTVPLFKRMFRALYISRSLHTMGELVNAGVPMLDTLHITAQVAGNRQFKRLWQEVYVSVKQGKKIAQPLFRSRLLPKSVVQMVSAGEESGKLGEVLDEVSGFYAKQLRETIKTVTSMIEPIMIMIMGGIVGFIAMAIILPIFKLSTLVK